MSCEPMDGVTLTPKSKEVMKNIAQKIKLGKKLKTIIAGGTLFNALVDNNAIPVLFNVTSTDWVEMAKAIKSVDSITQRAVQTEIEMRVLGTVGKENIFWKNMYECY